MDKQIQQKIFFLETKYNELIQQQLWEQAYQQFKSLLILKNNYNIPSNTIDFIRICQLTNYVAMINLKYNDYSKSQSYLKRAQKYCKYSAYLTLVTYNNWGCYYKKCNNHSMALVYINKAIKIGQSISMELFSQKNYQKIKFLAQCYLNLCAVLSNMNEHQLALQNANIAIKYIQNELFNSEIQYKNDQKLINDRHNILIIAKFNRAVELEHLKRYIESKIGYLSLQKYIIKNLNENHYFLKKINKALTCIQNKLKLRKSSLHINQNNFLNKNSIFPNISGRQNSDNNQIQNRNLHYEDKAQDKRKKMSRAKVKTRSNLLEISNLETNQFN